jgi:hypothetical protein
VRAEEIRTVDVDARNVDMFIEILKKRIPRYLLLIALIVGGIAL